MHFHSEHFLKWKLGASSQFSSGMWNGVAHGGGELKPTYELMRAGQGARLQPARGSFLRTPASKQWVLFSLYILSPQQCYLVFEDINWHPWRTALPVLSLGMLEPGVHCRVYFYSLHLVIASLPLPHFYLAESNDNEQYCNLIKTPQSSAAGKDIWERSGLLPISRSSCPVPKATLDSSFWLSKLLI